jgi:hypothetical protein
VEGGFHPADITPRPPFRVSSFGAMHVLEYDADLGQGGERTVLGGLKTKNVDVVVVKDGIGPTIAVSMKGTLNAFRNLTNRMEEAVGDCTNLHISYPSLVYGFLQVLRGIREAPGVKPNDIAICQTGEVADAVVRYHNVLARLAGRSDIRDVTTKYEAIALLLANPDSPSEGQLYAAFPSNDSPLNFSDFFKQLYDQYDQRYVYAAPLLEPKTRRLEWDPTSPILTDSRCAEYEPRVKY